MTDIGETPQIFCPTCGEATKLYKGKEVCLNIFCEIPLGFEDDLDDPMDVMFQQNDILMEAEQSHKQSWINYGFALQQILVALASESPIAALEKLPANEVPRELLGYSMAQKIAARLSNATEPAEGDATAGNTHDTVGNTHDTRGIVLPINHETAGQHSLPEPDRL